jgi:hypothetical protein
VRPRPHRAPLAVAAHQPAARRPAEPPRPPAVDTNSRLLLVCQAEAVADCSHRHFVVVVADRLWLLTVAVLGSRYTRTEVVAVVVRRLAVAALSYCS